MTSHAPKPKRKRKPRSGVTQTNVSPAVPEENPARREPAQARASGPPHTLKAAHEALQTTAALLTEAQQIGRMGSWDLNLATGQLIWSEQLYRLLGLKPFDPPITKERILELAYPPDREGLRRRTGTSARSGQFYEAEVRFVLPDGRIRLLHTRSIPIADATGRITRLVGLSEDITERKEVHERLRRSETLLAQAEQLANMGSWEYDNEREMLTWSAQFYRMLGFEWDTQPIPANEAHKVIHPDDFERAVRDINALQAEGRPLDNELRFITRNGDVRIFHSRAVAIA